MSLTSIGVTWADAHGDFNTAEPRRAGISTVCPLRSPLDIGDPGLLAVRQGAPVVEGRHAVLVGTRTLDDGEKALLKQFPMA
jgi:arginase